MGTIGAKAVVAVFESKPAAEGAKATLMRAGVPENRIAVSAQLTDDDEEIESAGGRVYSQ
jgi:hypothetical protein